MTRPDSWTSVAEELGPIFADRAAGYDQSDAFVMDNYRDLKARRLPSALVPKELGGGGASHAEMCEALRVLGRCCPSTALALSMHAHLVAAAAFKHRHGMGGERLLRAVAEGERILVSTGATDWIDSNGEARKVEGGYRVRARKVFGSGSPAADMLVTTIAWADDPDGPSVLHFPVPFSAEGVKILDDWRTLGMRGTGSHTVLFEDVFVPDDAIELRRPQGRWHKAWDVALGVAPPLYMAPYVGVAEAAAELALEQARKRAPSAGLTFAAGALVNACTRAEVLWRDMVALTGDYAFTPELAHSDAMLVRKTLVTEAVQETVRQAMEVAGGISFYRRFPLERLFRDVQAAHYHPLPEKRQLELTGRLALNLPPLV